VEDPEDDFPEIASFSGCIFIFKLSTCPTPSWKMMAAPREPTDSMWEYDCPGDSLHHPGLGYGLEATAGCRA